MELTDLIRFKEVAECENITKAAERLFISQPGLSKTIMALENELECKLFTRGNNSIKLTDAGKNLLQHSEKVIREVNNLKESMLIFSSKAKSLSFCASAYSLLRYFIPLLNKAYPEITIFDEVAKQSGITSGLLNELYDIAITYEPISGHKDIYNIPICEDRLLIVASLLHPFANRKSLCLKDLHNQNVIRISDSGYLPDYLNDMLKTEHVEPNFLYQKDIIICRELIKNSQYLSFTSTLSKNYFAPEDGKILIPISDKNASLTCYISYKKQNEKRIAVFKSFIREHYKEIMTY